MPATIIVILDTRKIKRRINKYPLKLRVTFERSSKYYPTIFNLSEEDFKKLQASRISMELQQIREQVRKIEGGAQSIIDSLDPFSFEEFEKDYIRNNNI